MVTIPVNVNISYYAKNRARVPKLFAPDGPKQFPSGLERFAPTGSGWGSWYRIAASAPSEGHRPWAELSGPGPMKRRGVARRSVPARARETPGSGGTRTRLSGAGTVLATASCSRQPACGSRGRRPAGSGVAVREPAGPVRPLQATIPLTRNGHSRRSSASRHSRKSSLSVA